MKKRQLKKEAYKLIVKEGRSHQETFEALRPQSSIGPEDLANEISKVPSKQKNNEFKTLRYILIGALGAVIILRIISIYALTLEMNLNTPLLLLGIILGIFVPVLGIIGILISKPETYSVVALLLILGIFRSLRQENVDLNDPITWAVLAPFILAIGLSFFLMFKLKTPFTKKVNKETSESGEIITKVQYTFEEQKLSNSELLDEQL